MLVCNNNYILASGGKKKKKKGNRSTFSIRSIFAENYSEQLL